MNETRLIRLIALWIVCIASIGLAVWSAPKLITTLVKATTGGYESTTTQTDMYGMGYGGYYNPCIPAPIYPPLSVDGMQNKLTAQDKAALDKYNEEMKEYNAKIEVECKADMEKKEMVQKKTKRSLPAGDLAFDLMTTLLAAGVAWMSLKEIKKAEASV